MQADDMRFNHITNEDGLSSNHVNVIAQDHYGFIWVGTIEGLNRYDGYEIKKYTKVLNDSSSLYSNKVYSLFIDTDSTIWVGTEGGISRFDVNRESFVNYIPDTSLTQSNVSNKVTAIHRNSKGDLYIGVERGKLYKYDDQTDRFEYTGYKFRSIRKFIIDDNDGFWIATESGVNYFNEEKRIIKQIQLPNQNNEYKSQIVKALYEDGDTIWVGSMEGTVAYILKSDFSIHLETFDNEPLYLVFDIYKSDNVLYVASSIGLLASNRVSNTNFYYTYITDNKSGINAFSITYIFEDKQGNFWLGSEQGGLNISKKGKKFHNINRFSQGYSIDMFNVETTIQDSKGNLWVGSYNGGIDKINLKTGEKKLYLHNPDNPKSLNPGSVHEIFEDSKQNIWIGTYFGGLQKYDSTTDQFISIKLTVDDQSGVSIKDIRSIEEDDEGNLWLMAHSFGVVKYNLNTKELKFFKKDYIAIEQSIADDWGTQIIKGSNNLLWMATPSGLSSIHTKTEEVKSYFHNPNDTNSLCNNSVLTVFEDSYKNLWIGTSFGLSFFNTEQGLFSNFYIEDGLASNQIKGIYQEKPEELWLTTGDGISRINYRLNRQGLPSLSIKNYSKNDNLQDNFFWPNSGCVLRDGRIAIGSESGIILFKPDEIVDNLDVPEVYISDVKISNKSVKPGDDTGVLDKSILETNQIKLNYKQNFISFRFVAINYIATELNQFKYKLEGFDNEWIETSDNREISYTNLNPGTYVFKVLASNNDSVWNTTGDELKITITPPYWETLWFRVLAGFLAAGLILLFVNLRISSIRRQKQQLKSMVDLRTEELVNLNQSLVKKNNQISTQNQEIKEQSIELISKSEKIQSQNNKLEEQNREIQLAYEELNVYRNQLEELVEERTKELHIAKNKAEESDRLKSSFLANMSHEIRTPLNSIVGFSNLLADDDLTPQERKNFSNIISANNTSLLSLINDIIDFSKIEAGYIEIHRNEISLQSIITDIQNIYGDEKLKMIEPLENDIAFKVAVPDTLKDAILFTDEVRVKQVLSILINNALKFTKKGYVQVACEMSGNKYILYKVKDTGIGISPNDKEVIFSRFRKIEDNKDNIYRGAGLGLSIAYNLVELLGGNISVESKLGEGSTFMFTIPISQSN